MSSSDKQVQANLKSLAERITAAASAAGRPAVSIVVVAVSKTFDAGAVLAAMRCGQQHFAENYVQEALPKIDAVRKAATGSPLQWHFIGPIQSNKTRAIAERFDWVQSVDRADIARRLSAQRPESLPPLNVLLQVNASGEASKRGVAPERFGALAAEVAGLPRLRLRGLMAIPAPSDDPTEQRRPLHAMKLLFEHQRAAAAGLPDWDTLSMGMSADLEAAIAEGATMLRIGTAIFGSRVAR